MSRRPVIRRKGEQGFALLLVFAMAAAIALMLYTQMPRVAFESERDKEQLLIDRGGQYQRAIQVYYATFKRYPARIEDLENTNDKRFLRRRYIDPFTGKDEWRIVHTNGLFLTDSKVQKPPATPGTDGSNQLAGVGSPAGGTAPGGIGGAAPNTGASATPGTNGTSSDPNTPPPVNAMVAARPSDRTLPGNQSYANPTAPGVTSQNFQNFNQNPPNYNDPASFPPISLFPNGYNAPQQGQQQGNGQPNGNQPGFNQGLNQGLNPGLGINQPGANQPGLNQLGLNQPGLNQPGLNQPGLNQVLNPLNLNQQGLPSGFPQPNPGQPNAGLPTGIIGTPSLPNGQQGLGQQGVIPPQPGQQQFQGQQFPVQQPLQGVPGQPIQLPGQPPPGQIPGGAPGAPSATPGLNMIQQLLTTPRAPPPGIGPSTTDQNTGAAIAGVASKFAGPSIKSYGGRTDYSEWEFVFQPQQQQVVPQMGQQQPNGQQTGQQQTGQQATPQQSGLGLGTGPGVGGPGGLPVPNH